jgi:hypothetical protein
MKHKDPPLFEFRIKYNAGAEHSAINNYHYYMAENVDQAFSFHTEALRHNHVCVQNLSIEKLNPYSNKWEDYSDHITDSELDFSNEC